MHAGLTAACFTESHRNYIKRDFHFFFFFKVKVLNELLVVVVVFCFSSAASLSLSSLSFFISNFHLIDNVWEETTRDRSYSGRVAFNPERGTFFRGFFDG